MTLECFCILPNCLSTEFCRFYGSAADAVMCFNPLIEELLGHILYSDSFITNISNISSWFPNDSEASASESLENHEVTFPRYYMRSDACNSFNLQLHNSVLLVAKELNRMELVNLSNAVHTSKCENIRACYRHYYACSTEKKFLQDAKYETTIARLQLTVIFVVLMRCVFKLWSECFTIPRKSQSIIN